MPVSLSLIAKITYLILDPIKLFRHVLEKRRL